MDSRFYVSAPVSTQILSKYLQISWRKLTGLKWAKNQLQAKNLQIKQFFRHFFKSSWYIMTENIISLREFVHTLNLNIIMHAKRYINMNKHYIHIHIYIYIIQWCIILQYGCIPSPRYSNQSSDYIKDGFISDGVGIVKIQLM